MLPQTVRLGTNEQRDGFRGHVVVLLFVPGLPPRHQLMLRSLRSRGWDISAIAWDRGVGDAGIPSDATGLIDRWHWIRLPGAIGSASNVLRLPRLYGEYRRAMHHVPPPDLTIFSHLFLLPLMAGWPGKKLYDAPEMFALDLSFYFGPWRKFVQPAIGLLEGLFVRGTDGVTTVDSCGDWLAACYRRWQSQVEVLWNVPARSDDPLHAEIEGLREQYSGRKVVAYVGGLKPEKGLRVAIKAASIVAKAHPESLFTFIGPLRDNQAAVAALVKDCGVEENVRFVAPMPYRNLLAHLHHAQIGLALHQHDRIYPYVSAGNGRKFFTYMQAGLPIVAPDFGEIGRAVQLADCGMLVDTEDAQAVADTVIHLLDHPDFARRLGANGRQAFEERFNWEIEEQKFLAFIDQVMSK